MALIDLKTDLKSLKYSKDRIGGGSSNQPFVQKPIPDSFSAVGNTGGLDVLTRGGSLAFQSTADDVSRLTKLLLTPSTFQGPFFTIKQNVLSRQGVQTQASPKGLNEGYYLPTNTLAQVAVSSAGLHFNKNGLNPIPGLPGSLTTYSDVIDSVVDLKKNRLLKLTDSFINKRTDSNILLTYPGGPGSILGLGVTTISIPGNQRTGINTGGDILDKYFGSEGVKYPLYDLLPPPELLLGKESAPTDTPQYLIPPVPALKYKAFTNPRPISLDYRRYLSLSYNAGISDLEPDQIKNRTAYQDNTLISVKTAPKGTQAAGIAKTAYSTYAKENLPDSKIYNLQGFTSIESLLGASVSASLKTDPVEGTPGTKNTNTLVTIKASTNGYGFDRRSNSSYAIANNLTGSLYGPITGSLSNSGRVITPFIRTSEPTVYAGTDFNPVNVTTEDYTAEYTYTAAELQQAPSYRPLGQIQDFRQKFRNKGGDALTVGADIIAPSYTEENIENRVHLGNPGTKGDVSNYVRGKVRLGTTEKLGPLDTINALPLYSSTEVKPDNEKTVNDLVKFRIAVLDSGGEPAKTFIHFRAFLDNVSDNYSADWQSYKYVGRGENFYTYSGFERKMSLSWTVYAQSKEELIPMYKKLNFLASTLAPDYNGGFMRGTLVQLTIGGYVYEQPGFITGLNYEITEATPWEIGITGEGFTAPDNLGDDSVKELPHMIKVSGFSFTPIHTFIPQVQKKGTGTLGNGPQQYIALSNGKDNNYNRD